jgi:hypothetical protein
LACTPLSIAAGGEGETTTCKGGVVARVCKDAYEASYTTTKAMYNVSIGSHNKQPYHQARKAIVMKNWLDSSPM